ncbi:alpha/beta hydrolase [Nostoc ellipsosporum NOK]|nr:alpha/beta hydrolase [Nostoc ellipsosporum NOK]
MRYKRKGFKIIFWIGCLLAVMFIFSRCILCKMSWSDAKAQRIFKNKNVPFRIGDTAINNHRLHYAIVGDDSLPTIIFVHGSPGGWIHYAPFMWDEQLLKKFRMVSIDRPGFGHSDFGSALPLQEQADVVGPLLMSFRNKYPVILCGHSLGGPLVAKIAAEHPEAFPSIILVAAALDPQLEKKETWRHVMNYQAFNWLLPGAFQPSNTELLYLKKDLVPLATELSNIRSRVHFIHGDNDTWVPLENVAYGRDKMTSAASVSVDTIKGGDHNFPWKKQEQFKQILLNSKF